jgi:hypothetical protein
VTDRIGILTLLEAKVDKDKHGNWLGRYLCDCGNEKIIVMSRLRLSSGKYKSCGCLSKGNGFKKGSIPHNRKEPGHSGLSKLFNQYKTQAKRRDIEFQLTREDVSNITSQNCTYCGVEPSRKCVPNNHTPYGEYTYNGIDRVDNTKGYIEGNCTPCCFTCNSAKRDMTLKDFLEWVSRVYRRSSGGIDT